MASTSVDRIPLIIAFTPNYLVPAAVTLLSILKSLSEEVSLEVICLMTQDLDDKSITQLQGLCGQRVSFRFVNLKGKLGDVYVDPRYSEAASYRLMMPELLPEYDRAIYIDCDVIVRNDLYELYAGTDLADNWLAAVYEAPLEHQVERFKAIGCNPQRYFNSGFLIMNLAKMREDGVSAKLIDALKVDYLEFPDQDALNQVCQGHVLGLSPVYNSIRTFFLPQYKANFLKVYSVDDWDAVQRHGTVHYTGGKPWNILTVKFSLWWGICDSIPLEIRKEWGFGSRGSVIFRLCTSKLLRGPIDFLLERYRAIKSRLLNA